MLNKFLVCITIILFLNTTKVLSSDDIPILVIAPSKKPQSISTVGSSVVVLDEKFLQNSSEYFLGDVLANNTSSANFFQSGGYGASSAIQLRGLPKRYSTVYIDGVKMSDPSSVSGDYDFNHILTSQISRVEILKGNQGSVYGSGAIGGTINITTKKAQLGKQKNIMFNTGSYNTNNFSLSISGADELDNYYVGFERFQTEGISAMTHNDEKDGYKNNTFTANYGTILSDGWNLNSNLRVTETNKQYDKEVTSSGITHNEEEDGMQVSGNISLEYKINEKFTNTVTLSNTYIKRVYQAAPGSGNTQKTIIMEIGILIHIKGITIIT